MFYFAFRHTYLNKGRISVAGNLHRNRTDRCSDIFEFPQNEQTVGPGVCMRLFTFRFALGLPANEISK